MFVESCIFDLRSRAMKTLCFTAFLPITICMIKTTFLSLAWLSSCLVQTTWSSIRKTILSKLSLIPSSCDHDNRYLLQVIFEMHKKLITIKIEFGLNSKAL